MKDNVLKITFRVFLTELELLTSFRFASCSLQFIRELYFSEHPNVQDQIEDLKALLCEEGQIFWFILHFGEENNVRKWRVDQYVAQIVLYRTRNRGQLPSSHSNNVLWAGW